MRCQYCGEELPDSAERAVEDNVIDEIVVHEQDGDESYIARHTDYYCDPNCFVRQFGGGD